MATVAGSATNEPHLLIEDSPVFSLPSDIICIISTTILCGLRKTPRLYYLQVEVLRLVSRHWDLVIRGVACFWSVLHDEQRLKTMKRRLERSGDHSLDIYIRMKFAWQTKLLKEFVEQILPRVQRIRLLDINMIFMSEDVCQLVPQLLAALALTELSVIELVRKRSITMVAIAILQRLRSLTLHGVRAASWDLEPCAQLRNLSLTGCSLSDLLSILQSHPNLEKVEIHWSFCTPHTGGSILPSITLPQLHTLSPLEAYPEQVFIFLQCLTLPLSVHIRVSCPIFDYTETEISVSIAPFLRFVAAQLLNPLTDAIVDLVSQRDRISLQLSNINLSLEYTPTRNVNKEAKQKFIHTPIQTSSEIGCYMSPFFASHTTRKHFWRCLDRSPPAFGRSRYSQSRWIIQPT